VSTFAIDFDWQKKYYKDIARILRMNAPKIIKIAIADDETDMKEATDFVVTLKGGRVAVRIRKDVGGRYHDLTIRSRRRSGAKTELQKIKEGYADFYLYIWTGNENITDWWLVDVECLRSSGLLDAPRREIWNKDGGSAFIAFVANELEKAGALINRMQTA
jgi:hypothetical protein